MNNSNPSGSTAEDDTPAVPGRFQTLGALAAVSALVVIGFLAWFYVHDSDSGIDTFTMRGAQPCRVDGNTVVATLVLDAYTSHKVDFHAHVTAFNGDEDSDDPLNEIGSGTTTVTVDGAVERQPVEVRIDVDPADTRGHVFCTFSVSTDRGTPWN